MKQGWEIKKLGEVCEIICGQDYKSVQDDNGKYPIYGTGGIMGYASQYRCPANSVIIGRKGNINTPIYVDTEFWNVDTAFGVVPNPDILHPKFFFLFCKDYDFTRHDVSVTIPSLRRADILKIEVPIPPLPEQEKIVAELDCLSGILEKKRQQLKELDALAQAIFYEMFGDPVTNEKGWEVKKLGDIASFKNGLNFKKVEKGREYLFLGVSDFKDKSVISKVDEYSSILIDEEFSEEFLLKDGDIVFVRSNGSKELVGRNVLIYTGNKKIVYSGFCIRCRLTYIEIMPLYANNLLSTPNIKQLIKAFGRGANISNLNQEMLGQIPIVLPPLPLQQTFAIKIEAIEQQKALIKQSIAEVETLFNARMQEYFE